ncbi:type II secretion system F family protein [Demequina sp. NBRC 110053]|uniref:type II secretion system F family protein n=1 Tax=Demequina sp. NBRC 110053 TaxID=1570342 RepID=UPI001F17411B|nr:type II secretion system F family protein [Demequina sp. NBRC 110053]
MIIQAVVLGTMFALGASLVAAWLRARRPTLEQRIAPFVRAPLENEVAARETTVTPFPTLERLLAPVARDATRLLERWGVSARDLERRLAKAGQRTTPDQYRAQQVACAGAGLALGCVLGGVLIATRGTSAVAAAVLVIVAGAVGFVTRDLVLTSAVRKRLRRVIAELPTVVELLALAVAAGESTPAALERVAKTSTGVVAGELERALARVRAGERLPTALHRMASDVGVPAMHRFAGAIATAMDRGTPLADVLQAQAQDIRAAGHQELLEEGGRREIAMLVPVVFLVLPVTVIFAVYPGVVAINLGG